MRAGVIGAALAVSLAASVAQAQQSPLDGPLAAPGEAPAAPAAALAHPTKPKPHKAHHAKAKPAKNPAATQDAAVPHPTGETPAARAPLPTDAVDLGMKWSGTSDGSAQTHYQNGLNGSFGSGAEVGMKLHF